MSPVGNFCVALATFGLPLLYLPGFGNWVREPKITWLLLCAAGSGLAWARVPRPRTILWRGLGGAWILGWFGILAFQGLSLAAVRPENLGASWLALGLSSALPLLALGTSEAPGAFASYRRALAAAAAVVVLLSTIEIYFGYSVFQRALYLGLPVGGRNYLPIFLSLATPLLIGWIAEGRNPGHVSKVALFGLAWMLSTAVIFRTRTVWLTLTLQLSLTWLWSWRGNFARDRVTLAKTYSLALLLAVILASALPSRMNWKSERAANADFSNGRSLLWPVVAEIAWAHPTFGIGPGQYPLQSRAWISATQTTSERQVFSFLTPDSPAFNDYLQMTAELGLVGGLLFLLVNLGLPVFWMASGLRKNALSPRSFVLLLSCLSGAVGALFTNSFDRAEQLFLLGCNVGFLLSDQESPLAILKTPSRPMRVLVLTLAGSAAVVGLLLAVRFALLPVPLRSYSSWKTFSPTRLAWAYRAWPWDLYWNESHSAYLWDLRDPIRKEWEEQFLADRESLWPSSPDVAFLRAWHFDRRNDLVAALRSFTYALVEIPNGRCRTGTLKEFASFARKRNLNPSKALQGGPSSHCAKLLPGG